MIVLWVVVADSRQARIFTADKPLGAIEEIKSFDNPLARQHQQDLISDRPGRSVDVVMGGHGMETKNDAKQQQAIVFAKSLCQHLQSAHQAQEFNKLIIVASPHFLGLLRDNLASCCKSQVEHSIDKNLVHMTTEEIRQHLPEKLYSVLEQ
jgi:protein required for attachment to host cells